MSNHRKIVEMVFGSHVYGTNLPESDSDIKAVHIPTAYEILLGCATESINTTTKTQKEIKNTTEDIDFESHTLKQYFKLLIQGQTIAFDMLFTPKKYWRKSSPLWEYIIANKDKFISKNIYPFVGYCRSQASKYSIKGNRVQEAKKILSILQPYSELDPHKKLEYCIPEIKELLAQKDSEYKHVKITEKINKNEVPEYYLSVCEKQIPFGASVKHGFNILSNLINEYGKRTAQTEKDEYDRKALYHAFRVSHEALELLRTGTITFPRPEVDLLMDVRLGKYKYEKLQEMLDSLLLEVELAFEISSLPVKPDCEFANNLIYWTYKSEVELT